jgi:hypothetical protein
MPSVMENKLKSNNKEILLNKIYKKEIKKGGWGVIPCYKCACRVINFQSN